VTEPVHLFVPDHPYLERTLRAEMHRRRQELLELFPQVEGERQLHLRQGAYFELLYWIERLEEREKELNR
jgi:hypothetical protein